MLLAGAARARGALSGEARYTPQMIAADEWLTSIARQHNVLALYLFGSRADDGLAQMAGSKVSGAGSDLDVGVLFADRTFDHRRQADLQVALEDRFAPLRVDLVPLQRVDALFQFKAIDGHRVLATDSHAADEYELVVMRRTAELAPIEAALERQLFQGEARS